MQTYTFEYPVRHDDLDFMGIVGNAEWVTLLTRARIELLDRINFPLSEMIKQKTGGVVAEMTVKYLKPARFGDKLSIGEDTAFSGFGSRIASSSDISTRNWLCIHLLDESKHTDGFSALLNYLYPTWRGKQEKLFSSRDAVKYYGYTHRTVKLVEWLICTQIAEVYGRQCYKALLQSLQNEPVVNKFLGNIVKDEARHIAYIGSLINKLRENMDHKEWDNLKPFIVNMIILGRNMFEARKKGKTYSALKSLDIDATEFCNIAEHELKSKFL